VDTYYFNLEELSKYSITYQLFAKVNNYLIFDKHGDQKVVYVKEIKSIKINKLKLKNGCLFLSGKVFLKEGEIIKFISLDFNKKRKKLKIQKKKLIL